MQGVMHMIMGHDHDHKFVDDGTESPRPPGMMRCFPGTAGGILTTELASFASLTASSARTESAKLEFKDLEISTTTSAGLILTSSSREATGAGSMPGITA